MALPGAFISNASTIGGGERCLEDLFNGLGRRLSPLVFCPGPGPFPDLLRSQSLEVETRLIRSPAWDTVLGFAWDTLWLRRRLAGHRAAFVHANSPLSTRPVALAARSLGLPLICHVHYPMTEEFVRWVFRVPPAPSAFIFVCDDLQRQSGEVLSRTCPWTSQHVVYNGIDVEAFAPAPYPDGPERHVGIVANLQPVKGHEDFLQMAARLSARHPHVRFHIVGDDVQQLGRRPVLEALVQELKLADIVKFWGFVPDVRIAYRSFEFLVCSSHEEASPRCLMEAQAMGRPVVATRVNGIPDVIEDGANGLLVPAGRPEALAEAVERLLADAALCRALATEGRRRVEARYSIAAYAAGVANVYHSLGLGELVPDALPAGSGQAR
jgi:glycosyltransferase involved in cell wall biosynthesis